MKVALWAVGKVKNKELIRWMESYRKRVRKFHPVDTAEILVREKSTDPDFLRKAEGERVLSKIGATDILVLWDEGGQTFTSPQLAEFLENKMMTGVQNLIFLIGGAHGFSPAVYERANHKISLSRMTFPHDLARLMAMEQLYRAFSILHHSPYHH